MGCILPIELEASRLLGHGAADLLPKQVEPFLCEVRQLGTVANLLAYPRELLVVGPLGVVEDVEGQWPRRRLALHPIPQTEADTARRA